MCKCVKSANSRPSCCEFFILLPIIVGLILICCFTFVFFSFFCDLKNCFDLYWTFMYLSRECIDGDTAGHAVADGGRVDINPGSGGQSVSTGCWSKFTAGLQSTSHWWLSTHSVQVVLPGSLSLHVYLLVSWLVIPVAGTWTMDQTGINMSIAWKPGIRV